MIKVVLLGASGGMGSEVKKLLEPNYTTVTIDRGDIDLALGDSVQINRVLSLHTPDIIINCAGVFGDNNIDYDSIFNVNVKTNWNILNYYKENPPEKQIKLIVVGSSSYVSGRRNYILYAASKAALHNIYEGALEFFAGTNLIIGLVHPRKTNTKMLDPLGDIDRSDCLDPKYVAKEIINFVESMQTSSYININ